LPYLVCAQSADTSAIVAIPTQLATAVAVVLVSITSLQMLTTSVLNLGNIQNLIDSRSVTCNKCYGLRIWPVLRWRQTCFFKIR
jgi:hypothetical protein